MIKAIELGLLTGPPVERWKTLEHSPGSWSGRVACPRSARWEYILQRESGGKPPFPTTSVRSVLRSLSHSGNRARPENAAL